jgi:hypothetical protein
MISEVEGVPTSPGTTSESGASAPSSKIDWNNIPDGPLTPTGFLPFWTIADSDDLILEGLSYILQQINRTNSYTPNIGQVSAAKSALEGAIRTIAASRALASKAPAQTDREDSREDK